MYLYSAVVP